jgi:N utilization substance protein B
MLMTTATIPERKKARELTLQKLFAKEFFKDSVKRKNLLAKGAKLKDMEQILSEDFVDLITTEKASLDEIINKHVDTWPVEKLAYIDKNILRIAVYEIYNLQSVPVKVSINEAIELAKKYGSESSYKFINGVLGSVVRALTDQNFEITEV